jgi:Rrf2 family protein
MKITKATEYALRVLAVLAGETSGVRSAPALSRATGIPGRFLAKICSRLVSAGLLVSYPGARGGYALARPSARISVWDVVQAVEDDPRLLECLGPDGQCAELATCGLRPVFERAQKAMEAEFMRTTLDEVVRLTEALKSWPRPEAPACAGATASARPRRDGDGRAPAGSSRAEDAR